MRRFVSWLLLAAATSAVAGQTVRTEAAGLRFTLPSTWTRVPTAAATRAAQYRLPAAGGDTAETEFVLLVPDDGQRADARKTIDRWSDRFTQPDGRPSREVATVTTRTVKDLRVTAVDLGGTYVGAGSGSTTAGVSDYRMLGAVVDGPRDQSWYFQMLGPAASVGAAKVDFDSLVRSLEPHR